MIDLDFTKQGGLVPVVVQDADDGTVLMLAYMNSDALRQTLETQLTSQRDHVLREFSLDNKEGALARMIGERILEFRDGWGGVAPPLVVALEQLGGERAEEYLDEIAEADVAGISEHAVAALQRMRGR